MNGIPFPTVLLHNLAPEWPEADKASAVRSVEALYNSLLDAGQSVILVALENRAIENALRPFSPESHIVLNWCEGIPGVDHSEADVAEALERLGFTFTGADSAALRLSGDKQRVKERLERSGIPTPAWRVYETPDTGGWTRFPAIVKPVHEHCSQGIDSNAVVMDRGELAIRIEYILDEYGQAALVEDFIDGREFHVSLWGNGLVQMLPPAEMDFSGFPAVKDRLCTYESKFVPGSRHYEGIQTLLPAPLAASELEALETVCRRAYRALGCRDYGRLDLRVREGVWYVLDVNPNADISVDASFACAAEVAGYSYGEMGTHILSLATHRRPIPLGEGHGGPRPERS